MSNYMKMKKYGFRAWPLYKWGVFKRFSHFSYREKITVYFLMKSALIILLKEIGLQRLSLSSEDGSWRDEHFATNFMKVRLFIRKL